MTDNPISLDDSLQYIDLTDEQQRAVQAWIAASLVQDDDETAKTNTYGYKHAFEHSEGGFHLTNGMMKGALLVAGYRPVNMDSKNWTFNCRYRWER